MMRRRTAMVSITHNNINSKRKRIYQLELMFLLIIGIIPTLCHVSAEVISDRRTNPNDNKPQFLYHEETTKNLQLVVDDGIHSTSNLSNEDPSNTINSQERRRNPKNKRTVEVINNSPVPFSISWVDDDDVAHDVSDTILPGASFTLQTFVGDRFDIFEEPDEDSGLCEDSETEDEEHLEETCWNEGFTVPEGEHIEVTIDQDFVANIMDTRIYAQQQATTALHECLLYPQEEELQQCLQTNAAAALKHWNYERQFHIQSLQKMGASLEQYQCYATDKDDNDNEEPLETSPPLQTYQWEAPDYIMHQVDVLHNRPSLQIHVLHNFIEPDECHAIFDDGDGATTKFDRAPVFGGEGESSLSKERRAWQASIQVPWHLWEESNAATENHPLVMVSRRVYAYTNHVLELNVTHPGQEDLIAIQYFGPEERKKQQQFATSSDQDEYKDLDKEETFDQYTAHCDGHCDGRMHAQGDRIATMIMYCQTPEHGGNTYFRNAGINVQPQPGMAVFFSYVDPVKLEMDTGLTEHAGCPVFEGTKRIVTQWVRLGVDQEHPWDFFVDENEA